METLRLFRSKMDYRVGSVKSYFVCFLILSPISVCLVQCKDEEKKPVKQCFICQSKFENQIQKHCPGDGVIDKNTIIVYKDNCTGHCFTRTDDLDSELVYRGCTDLLYRKSLPDPLPEDGCYTYYEEVWCICQTDLCNRQPLVVYRGCADSQWGLPDPMPPDGCYTWYMEVWCICNDGLCNNQPIGEAKTDFEAHLPKEEEKNTNNANLTFINTKLTFIFSLILLTVCK